MSKNAHRVAVLCFLLIAALTNASAQGTSFNYQGRLNDGGSPANGVYDFRFRLAADVLGNTYVASAVLTNGVGVTNGLFSTSLDFGVGVFNGAPLWLEVDVRTNGAAGYTALSPLQAIAPAPYAIFAGNAGTASTVSGPVSASQLTGSIPAGNLSGAYGGTILLSNPGNSFAGNGAELTSLNANNLASGTVPLARLSGITSNQLDPATWQFLVALASAGDTNRLATNTVPTGMVLIPGGTFTMGDNLDGEADAKPVTTTVSTLSMDTNLVSYCLWTNIHAYAVGHGYNFVHPGQGKAPNHPVVNVDWFDCAKWCNARSQQAGLMPVYYTDAALTQIYTNGEPANVYPNWVGSGFRLPTEAEWEYAARGGLIGQRFPWGMTISESQANYQGNTGAFSYDLGPSGYNALFATGNTPYTSPVGSFAPNGYGLYDMAGNVWEWCWDWYGASLPGGSNPKGPTSGSTRLRRGGSWYDVEAAQYCRAADRNWFPPSFIAFNQGFRSVLSSGQ